MFIPINTDAPLYHFPYGTIALIVANVVCFAATGCAMNERLLEPWLLEYGNGINPLEWIPAAFAHGGFGHLIGNMFFLWGFGLVVEGKLGWRRFIPLYLAMAAAWGAGVDLLTVHRTDAYVLKHEFDVDSIEQLEQQLVATPDEEIPEEDVLDEEIPDEGNAEAEGNAKDAERDLLHEYALEEVSLAKGRCLGASGVIFSLLAISLVWAPKNEMHIVGFLFYRPVSFEVTIMTFSLWYFVLNILELMLSAFEMGSSGLHMVGIVIGFAVGIVFLKRDWVDCEKWDLFAVLSGKYGRFAEEDWALGAHGRPDKVYGELQLPEPTDEAESETRDRARSAREKKSRQAISHVNQLIDDGDVLTAADELFSLRLQDAELCPNLERTRKLAIGLLKAQAFDEAEFWLQEFIGRFPEENSWARIRMAQLLLNQRLRPAAALKMLKGLPAEGLNDHLRALAKKIAASAKEQVRNGVKDAESEW